MFTGIVETMGLVEAVIRKDSTVSGGDGFSVTVGNAHTVLTDVHIGDSIAVDGNNSYCICGLIEKLKQCWEWKGVCLTVTEFDEKERMWFKVGVSPETLRKTTLGKQCTQE